MMRLMGAMEIFTAQQQEDIKDEVWLTQNRYACGYMETQKSSFDFKFVNSGFLKIFILVTSMARKLESDW